MIPPGWSLRPDGSFDLHLGSMQLQNAIPSLDGIPVRPVRVEVAGDSVTYFLTDGQLSLTFFQADDRLQIACRLTGFDVAPGSVEVIDHAQATGLKQVHKQGEGMCGGAGIKELAEHPMVESFAMVSLLGTDRKGVTIWANDHSRFENRYTISPNPTVPGHLIRASFRTESIPLLDGILDLPTLFLAETSDTFSTMRAAATDIGRTMNARPIKPASYHWCSWYYLYHNLDMPILEEYLEGFQATGLELDYFQIDAGNAPANGDWLLPSPRFPEGLAPAFAKIASAGYRPGIWIGPFMVGNRSRVAIDHPDWLLRDREGNLVTPWKTYGEPKIWGYRDEETYVLDSSHPEAFDYLRTVFRTLRTWGAVFFKTDFMFWGLQDSRKVRRHTPGKTSYEYFRDVLAMIREEIGDDAFWLGCIAPFFPFVGYADAIRIGGDVGASWNGDFGPRNMLEESSGDQHLNQVLWQNDPDVLLLRNFHNDLTYTEVETLALWQAILGGVVATSDPLHEMSAERQALWHFVRPPKDMGTAKLPFLGHPGRAEVALRVLASGDVVVLVMNASELRHRDTIALAELGLAAPIYAFVRTPQSTLALGEVQFLTIDLAPHASVLFHLSARPMPPTGPMLT